VNTCDNIIMANEIRRKKPAKNDRSAQLLNVQQFIRIFITRDADLREIKYIMYNI